jgi:hypothetical protein
MRWPPPQPSVRTLAGSRLVATDTSWSAGAGPEVHGPMAALLLVCTGRVAALPQLSGPGAAALTPASRHPRRRRRVHAGLHRWIDDLARR